LTHLNNIKLIRTHDKAQLPTRATDGSVGYDLRAVKDCYVEAGARALISTGWKICLPDNIEAQIRPRSGLAYHYGVTVLNAPGTIDPDYRGDLGVLLVNHGGLRFVIKPGDRIAQMVLAPVLSAIPMLVIVDQSSESEEFTQTERGEGGFGSTGTD